MRIKALRSQRAGIVADARKLLEKDNATAEDMAQFDAMMASADALERQIAGLERAEAVEASLAVHRDAVLVATGVSPDAQAADLAREKRIMVAWLSGRVHNLSDEDRAVMTRRVNDTAGFQNAAGTGTAAGGGYTIAPEFQRELLIAMKAFGGVRGAARTIETATGAVLPWPTMDDTSNVATIVGENTPGVPAPDLAFGSVSMQAWMYRSGYLLISLELLQDSAFDFDGLIRDAMAMRFARGQNAHFTNGSGVGQPQGIAVAAVIGKTGAAGQTASVTYDDLVDAQHSVDPAYRAGACWMMHDSSIKVLRKLKDTIGRPLWEDADAGLATMGSTVGTLMGAPVIVNQDMPVMAAGAKSILFGNFKNYLIRDVMGLRITRLNERFAENGQVGFIGFQRTDGRLISAAQPVKAYANSAT